MAGCIVHAQNGHISNSGLKSDITIVFLDLENRLKNRHFPFNAVTLTQNFTGRRGNPPPIIFAWIVRPKNALQLCR